jgi:sigma-54 specific flagellar transcriptional regulator A
MDASSAKQRRSSAIIGTSQAIRDMLSDIYEASPYNVNVLTIGPTGAGKELVAQTIHEASGRRGKLVSVNCAAIPRDLLEAELFGHEKGAFTGAAARRIGRFEEASKGTLFLDEIGDMPLELQGKLLRVLESRKISRIGSNAECPIDFRLVCATHQNLHDRVKQGLFREDLLFRLSVLLIHVPPLKHRLQDIPELIEAIARQMNASDTELLVPRFSQDGLDELMSYNWPGNVRELKNFCQRAAVLCRGQTVGRPEVRRLLNQRIDVAAEQAGLRNSIFVLNNLVQADQSKQNYHENFCDLLEHTDNFSLKDYLATQERGLIEAALDMSKHNATKASKLLGLHRTTLLAKMRKYGIVQTTLDHMN